jgi:hypothetical protein
MLLLFGGAYGGEALASRCCHVLVLLCCESLKTVLVCLGAVKPLVYAGGTQVPWRRLTARSLRPPPDADGVVALGGLGCALPLGFVAGCRGVVSLCVACRPHPRCRWCRDVMWSCLCTSVRLRRWHGAPVWTRLIGTIDYAGGPLSCCVLVCVFFCLCSPSVPPCNSGFLEPILH